MKIVSWNVNSLNVRLPHLLKWLDEVQPDIVALQETKLNDDKFPRLAIEAAGYHVAFSGEKGYNGVALLSRSPLFDVITDLPGLDDPQRRLLAATTHGIRVLNLYVVNGQAVGAEMFRWKLLWLERVRDWLAAELQRHPRLIVLGDFNITPDDRDVYDPMIMHESILCSSAERAALQRLLELGLQDTFRLFPQQPASFSWWDYQQRAFQHNRGLRLDLILASAPLAAHCSAAWIDQGPRTWERPSDHAPVIAEFDLHQ
ncbi:MAG TPA: exodeoxyribonuclease III [Gammaproteobacteria bacterium]